MILRMHTRSRLYLLPNFAKPSLSPTDGLNDFRLDNHSLRRFNKIRMKHNWQTATNCSIFIQIVERVQLQVPARLCIQRTTAFAHRVTGQ